MFPNYKEHGSKCLPGELVMFTSDQSHYSVKSCAAVSGLGTDNCIMIPSDEGGRMIASELEREIQKHKALGHIPFFVSATAGTTVLGAFDPITEIADICDKHGLWLHIDVSNSSYLVWLFSIFGERKKDEFPWVCVFACMWQRMMNIQVKDKRATFKHSFPFYRLLGVAVCCSHKSIDILDWLELNGKRNLIKVESKW